MDWSFERDDTTDDASEPQVRATTAGGESVTFPANWFGEDQEWRQAYQAILDACLPDLLSFEDDTVTVPRANAITALVEAESLSTDQSEALLAYFDSEGVVERSGVSVAVLFDSDSDQSLATDRWNAACRALADNIEQIDAELETGPDPEELADQVESQLEAIAEEIRDLTPGPNVPNPEELTDDQRTRFEKLKKDLVYYKNLQAANVDPPQAIEPGLADYAEKLRAETTPSFLDSVSTPLDAFRSTVEALTGVVDAAESEDMEALYDQYDRLVRELDALTES